MAMAVPNKGAIVDTLDLKIMDAAEVNKWCMPLLATASRQATCPNMFTPLLSTTSSSRTTVAGAEGIVPRSISKFPRRAPQVCTMPGCSLLLWRKAGRSWRPKPCSKPTSLGTKDTTLAHSRVVGARGATRVPIDNKVPSRTRPSKKKTVVEGPIFSIDVECVASGPTHNEREVAHIAVVDGSEQVVLNVYVKPDKPVFSYIEPLTGCNADLVQNGISLAEAVERVKAVLPTNAVLVGQNILKDVQWLGLSESKDFASMLDLAGLFRVYTPQYKNPVFHSLHHKAKALLGINQGQLPHTADKDAQLSIVLFKLYLELEANPELMAAAKQRLLDTPIETTFVKIHPSYEGACMGNRKSCTCGAPFFY